MFKCDVRTALDLLPRFNIDKRGRAGSTWPMDGNRVQLNFRVTPRHVDRVLRHLVARWDRSSLKAKVQWVDINEAFTAKRMWTLQRTCKFATLAYMLARGWKWQRWRKPRLPIYVLFAGKLVIWNGTHRSVLGILANKPIRARVIDLDAFLLWVKKNPDESKWNVRRVVRVRGKKRGHSK